MNQTDAYLKAGYKCKPDDARKRASFLVNNNEIFKRELSKARKSAAKKVEVDEAFVIKGWRDIATDKGIIASTRLAAYDSIAKHLGMFTGKGENQQNVYFVDSQVFKKPKTAGTSQNKIKANDPRTNGR